MIPLILKTNLSTITRSSGSERIYRPLNLTLLAIAALILSLSISRHGISFALVMILLPIIFMFTKLVFDKPALGLYAALVWGFWGIGAKRYTDLYIGGVKLGLGIDFLLFLTAIAFIMKEFNNTDFSAAKNGIVKAVIIWMGYNLLQIINPETVSLTAWFFAVRGVALNMLFAVPLAILILKKERHLNIFLVIWFSISLIAVLWGLRQLNIGLDPAEKFWISDPRNNTTHLLHGRLRVFSFYTDAGQFGAAMGHTSLAGFILAAGCKTAVKRLLYLLVAGSCLIGLFISGTRGALAVPVFGFLAYLIVNGNWKVLITGFVILALTYCFFNFTFIGQNNYHIGRMRQAVRQGGDLPSLNTRKRNQKILAAYLRNKPFGGGIGSAGYWGMRFSPHSQLARIPTDSWYVRIWVEEGVIGLAVFLALLGYFFIEGGRRINLLAQGPFRQKITALYAGVFGIAVASYGNQLFGQMPTGMIVYISMAFVFMTPPRAELLTPQED